MVQPRLRYCSTQISTMMDWSNIWKLIFIRICKKTGKMQEPLAKTGKHWKWTQKEGKSLLYRNLYSQRIYPTSSTNHLKRLNQPEVLKKQSQALPSKICAYCSLMPNLFFFNKNIKVTTLHS